MTASGGVICIDEFDKMQPEDRVAIHEVRSLMSQCCEGLRLAAYVHAICSFQIHARDEVMFLVILAAQYATTAHIINPCL